MGDRVVVTGAGGFIGAALCRRLVALGFEVTGLVRRMEQVPRELRSSTGFTAVECPFSAYRDFPEIVGARPCRAVYHLAWEGVGRASAGDPAWRANLDSVRAACELAEGARSLGAERFVFCGSDWMYKRGLLAPGLPGVFDTYGASKRAASDLCRQILDRSGVLFACALPANTFGPGDRSRKAVNTFIRALLRGERLNLVPAASPTDWVFIDDAADALASLLEVSEDGREWYLGHTEPVQFGSLLEGLRDAAGSDSELRFGVYPERTRVDYGAIDMGALGRATGFSCGTSFQEAFGKTIEWVRALDRENRS